MKSLVPDIYEGLPVVTAERMAAIDREAITSFGIPAAVLMENAGRVVAVESAALLASSGGVLADSLITVCCGRGNNGGDGLVAARYLKEMGAEVMVFLAPPKRDGRYSPEVQQNLSRAVAAGVSIHQVSEELIELEVRTLSSALLVDALLGTGATGKPAGPVHRMIQCMVRSKKPVVAVDIPSGLHPDTGHHSGVVVEAALTLALGLPKRGLLAAAARRYVGRLKVVDIGFPKEVLRA
ncbi:MAG: NAD(P)H-hydrate epimerase [Elusimicrobia bacterium]|nr:NAD(P)H-hydrate epimerase [Elusimicrobiota bacterium]